MPRVRSATARNEIATCRPGTSRSALYDRPSTSKAAFAAMQPITVPGGATITLVDTSKERVAKKAPPKQPITPDVTITPTTDPPTHPESCTSEGAERSSNVYEDFMKQQTEETLQHMFRSIETLFPQQNKRPIGSIFLPDRRDREFPFLLGLEVVTDWVSGQPPMFGPVATQFRCAICNTDFTPAWKWISNDANKPAVMCEECMLRDVRNQMKYKYP